MNTHLDSLLVRPHHRCPRQMSKCYPDVTGGAEKHIPDPSSVIPAGKQNNKPNKLRQRLNSKHRNMDSVHIHNESSSCWICVCEADCLVCLSSHCAVKDLTQRSWSCCCNTKQHFIISSTLHRTTLQGRQVREEEGGGRAVCEGELWGGWAHRRECLWFLLHLCVISFSFHGL